MKAILLWLPTLTKKLNLREEIQIVSYCMAMCIAVIHNGSLFLEATEQDAVLCHGTLYIDLYLELALRALQQRAARWKIRPKLHYSEEILEAVKQCPLNPRVVSTFGGENHIGRMAQICRAVHRQCASRRVVDRYLAVLGEEWQSFLPGRNG